MIIQPKNLYLFIFLSTQLLGSAAYSAESLNTKVHNQYNSFRALGMGNAFTAVADDYSGLMYNPAALAKRKKGEFQFTIAGAGLATKTTKLAKDIDDASKSATTESAKAQAISDALEPYYGAPLGARIQALEFFWARPNWGIALIPLDLSIDIGVHRQLGPALDLNIKKDTTLAYAYAKEINDTLAAGITAKLIHRDSVEQSVSALELASDSNILSASRFKEGINADFDLGFMWNPKWLTITKVIMQEEPEKEITPVIPAESEEKKKEIINDAETTRDPQSEPATELVTTKSEDTDLNLPTDEIVPAKPVEKVKPIKKEAAIKKIKKVKVTRNPLNLSLVVRNVISANFSKSNQINKEALEPPSRNPRVIDIGSNYEFAKWDSLTLRTTLDFRNLLHPNTTIRKSTHAGFEFDYSPNGWFKTQLRGGINQMYYTAGVTLLFGILEVDAVTYGEEVGTATTNVENRVIAAKIGMNF
ncbi:MAG: hypothetical protein WA160_09285 [Pseudobdellovibrio sp.]